MHVYGLLCIKFDHKTLYRLINERNYCYLSLPNGKDGPLILVPINTPSNKIADKLCLIPCPITITTHCLGELTGLIKQMDAVPIFALDINNGLERISYSPE